MCFPDRIPGIDLGAGLGMFDRPIGLQNPARQNDFSGGFRHSIPNGEKPPAQASFNAYSSQKDDTFPKAFAKGFEVGGEIPLNNDIAFKASGGLDSTSHGTHKHVDAAVAMKLGDRATAEVGAGYRLPPLGEPATNVRATVGGQIPVNGHVALKAGGGLDSTPHGTNKHVEGAIVAQLNKHASLEVGARHDSPNGGKPQTNVKVGLRVDL